MAPIADRLGELLERDVMALDAVTGPDAEAACGHLSPGEVVMLENLRFDPREEADDAGFAEELAALADAYVDDAFGAVHRAHASVSALPALMLERGRPVAAGRLLEREVTVLSTLLGEPARPFVAVLGGAKVSDKLSTIGALVERVDAIVVGGAMAFTFIAAEGGRIGASLVEPERFDEVRAAAARARERGVTLKLPEDVVAAPRIEADAPAHVVPADSVPDGELGLDIGPRAVEAFAATIAEAKTILWNGPMGVFELEPFASGTREVATAIAGIERVPRGRRGRQPRGDRRARAPGRVRPPLDRRGRLARIPRGSLAPGDRRAGCRQMTERRPMVAANWKMHKTHLEAIQAVQKLSYLLDNDDAERVEVVIVPPFTALRAVETLIASDRLQYLLGAQNVHWEDKGAFTGEISPPMLQALRVRYVIVGHSERRALFGETDETVNKKVRAVFAHAMAPILCVGETLQERDMTRTQERVTAQVGAALRGVGEPDAAGLVIAYEPIWAIGTGRNAEPADAGEVIGLIRATVADAFSAEVAAQVRVLYGGSVKPGNIRDFMAHPEIDGALVGGASLDPEELALIVKYR